MSKLVRSVDGMTDQPGAAVIERACDLLSLSDLGNGYTGSFCTFFFNFLWNLQLFQNKKVHIVLSDNTRYAYLTEDGAPRSEHN